MSPQRVVHIDGALGATLYDVTPQAQSYQRQQAASSLSFAQLTGTPRRPEFPQQRPLRAQPASTRPTQQPATPARSIKVPGHA